MIKKISIHFVILTLFVFPVFVFAVEPIATIENPVEGANNIMELLVAILNRVIMPVAAVGVVVWIIWAGFSYLLAQGNEKKIQEAHQRLLWSLIGAGVLLGAAGISSVVKSTIDAVIVP